MEESVTRKRVLTEPRAGRRTGFCLYEELVILVGSRSTNPLLPDPLSICLRAAILGDLIVDNLIVCNADNALVAQASTTDDCLVKKALGYVKKAECTVQKWLDVLNGESFNTKQRYQIKKMRFKVYKKLEEKKVLRLSSGFYKMDVRITDLRTRNELVNEVVEYLSRRGEKDMRIEILVCCLHLCKGLAPLLVSLTLQKQSTCKSRADDMIIMYKNYYRRECKKEDMVAHLLKALLAK